METVETPLDPPLVYIMCVLYSAVLVYNIMCIIAQYSINAYIVAAPVSKHTMTMTLRYTATGAVFFLQRQS